MCALGSLSVKETSYSEHTNASDTPAARKSQPSLQKGKKEIEVPPRLELGSLDSESKVLTITPWDQGQQGAQARKSLFG